MHTQATDLVTLDHLGDDAVSHVERGLELLRAIENTITALCYERRFFETMAAAAHDAAEKINKVKRVALLDPEGAVEEKFETAQAKVKELYAAMIEKRRYAQNDPNLTEDDGIVEEYTRSIAAVADLHNGINALRWAIGEHDADLQKPAGKTIKSAAELERFLDAL